MLTPNNWTNSVNDSVQFWGLSDQSWGSGLPFISNLLAHVDPTGWGSSNNSNQIWGGWFKNANIIINAAWGDSINARPAYLTRSLVNPHAARRCVYNNFLCRRRQERLWHQYNWHNNFVNA